MPSLINPRQSKRRRAGERLAHVLGRAAGVRAADLAAALEISIPTLHRLLHETTEPVFTTGQARRARYALRRTIRGDAGAYPLYAVDATGRATPIATLVALAPQGCWLALAGTDWPVSADAADGWWDGLPYPLYDMRPQGYLGRQLARAVHRALAVPDHPERWNDDDILFALSRIGADTVGNLILGDTALALWQEQQRDQADPLPEADTPVAYAALAELAVASGVAGSSAAGEWPKFPARRERTGMRTPHVLVKFSGVGDSPAVRRWADLLVCEHLALGCAGSLPGVAAARSRVLTHAGRTFLEVERFDRHGAIGRSPLCSLDTLNAALIGRGDRDWTRCADDLVAARLLTPADAAAIEAAWWFGQLIANTDMHLGNLSFRPVARRPETGRLALAPVYDMLPMRYAPLASGELPAADGWRPPLPLPRQRDAWLTACAAALRFWQEVALDTRISADFRQLGSDHAQALTAMAEQL